MTIRELINNIKESFSCSDVENAVNESKFIVQKAFSLSGTELLLKMNDEADDCLVSAAIALAEKRLSGLPLQYCLGEWDFMGETFEVGEGVLIPRPETEELCDLVLEKIRDINNPVIVDLCAGSGAIGLSLKKLKPDSEVFLVEKSPEALVYLKKNAEKLCKNEAEIIEGDVLSAESFKGLIKSADLIVSNPPYIKREELVSLQKEVQFEPKMALDGGEDGYDFYRIICRDWGEFLKKGGYMAFECGEEQAEFIAELFDEEKYETEIFKDFNAINRFVIGRKKL